MMDEVPDDQDIEDQMNDEEIQHFRDILKAFNSYEGFTLKWIQRLEKNYEVLSTHHKSLIPTYPGKLHQMRVAISTNQKFINQITESNEVFQNLDMVSDAFCHCSHLTATLFW